MHIYPPGPSYPIIASFQPRFFLKSQPDPFMHTEHTLRLPDGTDIFYTDSGAPDTLDYTTVVVVHRIVFNGYVFERLHEWAPKYNARLVLMNRRGYHGSTPFTDAEVEEMHQGRKHFQDRLALQLACFLKHFIEKESAPPVNPDRSTGGLVLVGWSLANATTLSLLANPTVVGRELYEAIEPYLRTLVMYDPPTVALGYPMPPDTQVYYPLAVDPTVDPEERHSAIAVWVSAFYDHSDLGSGEPTGVHWAKPSEVVDPADTATIDCYSAEERAKFSTPFPVVLATDFPLFQPKMQALLQTQTHAALFEENTVSSYFPRLNVVHISGTRTIAVCIWAYTKTLRMYTDARASGKAIRPVKFVLVPGANHLIHYHRPELVMREILGGFTQVL
ncbi:hypothetical protein FB45DRAFT_301796 [Roridomyces roridus]|uniref:AB hydrolase-1 domain-containing protein n=1 Tax=Roridomyces roridus TaxID=1738132 RepID=A0AAD7B7L8_9AGAR|nr:hypothetical protein FB45DRAFT_301796 [Roridomyces roridus]